MALDKNAVLDNAQKYAAQGKIAEAINEWKKLADLSPNDGAPYNAIGDLYLLGHPLIGAFSAHKSGHSLNNRLLRELVMNQEAWELITYNENDEAPIAFVRTVPAV